MAHFPNLSTGSTTQYPFRSRMTFRTNVQRFVDGTDQRYRELRAPILRWVIELSKLTTGEAAAVEEFFRSQKGRGDTFSFTDPQDGTEYSDCVFDSDTLDMRWQSETDITGTLVIRNTRI